MSRLLTSPMAGPPITRLISRELPPLSLMGKTCVTQLVRECSAGATLLNAVPPEKTSIGADLGIGSSDCGGIADGDLGAAVDSDCEVESDVAI